ncbi:MAG TPA: recombinase family protein [Bacillus bacterium]|nr:recombinase family protein [Bacillus sp. (in: firmicutes)]
MLGYPNKLERIKEIAIYLRKSRQDEGLETEETLATHRKILTEISEQHRWKYDIYEEVASSIDMDIRTELTKMLKQIETGCYDAVLVMDVDRLSRSVKDSAIIKAILAEHDVFIITADLQVIDLNEDNDSLVSDFMDVLSSFEYKQIRKRMMRGKRAGAQDGKWNNGIAPLGYEVNKEKKTLEIIDEEAAIIKYIFQRATEKIGITSITDELNKRGYKTKRKRPFNDVGVRRIIKNETYKGLLIRHRLKKSGNKRELHPKEHWVVVKDAFPAIVSEEIWEAANDELTKRSTEPMKIRAKTFGLSGFTKCGYCGYTLTLRHRKDRKTDKIVRGCHRKYVNGQRCKNSSISYYAVMEAIFEQLKSYETKLQNDITKLEIQENTLQKERKGRLAALENQFKKIDSALKQIDIAWEEMIINLTEYKEKRQKLNGQKEILNQEIKVLNNILIKNDRDEVKKVLEDLDTFLHGNESLTAKQLNSRLRSFIEKIELYNDKDVEGSPRILLYFV